LRVGDTEVPLTRAELLALPQRTARLPIACVEGWSTTQEWTGVPLSVLAERAGAPGASSVLVESLQPAGVLRRATLTGGQIAAEDALLALKVGGEDLSLDHGFPARIIVPALPGVHNTKWVATMTFQRA
jgi:DMSO/TMAO reductase YedYZ molybdopterin-dependent catalytic subunit